ncbi:efflux RND transporter permease subunit [Barnesiella sp. WM24]|uniref:efflux RND transporter permease subunit n=1 Tax=Barnesiella sp. WM24 TaxID=2558278 RepID=UPI001072E2FB|nr:efflux RND transporter permease subunit [Barnesiella sp. WM24]TFU92924.1 efflux RND transporter permease subunit [Barnesiella sp. WM24]
MLNKIIKFSLANRVTVVVLSGLLLLAGCAVLLKMDVDIFPDLNAPTVVVMTEAPGLAPEEVEKVVTYPVETAVNGATDVRRVRSSSATGFSVVWIEFDWGTDIYKARQIVAERLNEVAEKLPSGVGTPVIGPQSSILGEMLIIGLTSDSTSMTELRTIADRTIAPHLLSIGGVSQVSVLGGDVKEYQIQMNPDKMKHFDVTLDEVVAATESINDNASGGITYDYGNEYIIKGDINTSSVDELGNSVVRSDDRGIVLLSDVADIVVGGKLPLTGAASINGTPSVLLTVTKQPSTGTIELTSTIEEELSRLSATMPSDIRISTDIFRQSDFIDSSISNLQQSLFEGAIFVIVILFFFLMNVRTTLISLVALPMSIIVTIIVLNMLGMSINTMSLGGIAIAIGSLVDDAIVDVENVYKRLRENSSLPDDKRRSVLSVVFEASKEVRMPIFNSSLIIIASFLPLFFLRGLEGRMLIPLGISFIVALIASTVVALTLTPVLCSYLLKSDKADRLGKESWVARNLKSLYRRGLEVAFNHRKSMIAGVSALFILTLGLFFTLGRSFLPSFNEGSFTINVSALPGISLEESDHIGRIAEEAIMSVPEVKTVARKTGRAELDEHSLGVNVSEIEAPYVLSDRSRSEVVRELRAKLSEIPGVNIEIGQPISHRIDAMLSGTEAQIAIKIFGDDLQSLYSVGSEIKNQISDIPGIVDVNIEQQVGRPQLDIRPRREMLARYGIPVNKFAEFINITLGGKTVSQVYEGGLPYDVTLRVSDVNRETLAAISELMIDSNVGKIPLDNVADIVSTTGPNTINRENVSRRIVVSANVDDRDLRSAVNDIRKKIDDNVKMPDGYYLNYSGQFESESEASRTLALTSLGALIIIMMLLYSEFHDIKQTMIILVNMPLAMIGGILILRFTSGEINIPAIIGFISLLGITTRNGMLLISRYNHLAQEHVGLIDRIRTGSVDRLLPIMMTALTSALALIPLALRGGEPGNEIQSPMAIVILGGLITSTLLNIFVTPVLYYLTNRKKV